MILTRFIVLFEQDKDAYWQKGFVEVDDGEIPIKFLNQLYDEYYHF